MLLLRVQAGGSALQLSLLVLVTLMALGYSQPVPTPAPSAQRRIKLCFLFFSGVDDLGWTYAFNLGRLEAESRLKVAYPWLRIDTLIIPDMIQMPRAQQVSAIHNAISVEGCHMLISNTNDHFGDDPVAFVLQYPNVSFAQVKSSSFNTATAPNLINMGFAYGPIAFAVGAGAAIQSKTCIGIISAREFSTALDTTSGAVLGIHSIKPTLPVHVVTTGEWYWPYGEREAAEQLIAIGCDVIMRHTDPRDVDLYVQKHATRRGGGVMTVGIHSDLQQFVGDAVMTSIYVKWDVVIYQLVEAMLQSPNGIPINTPPTRYLFGLNNGGMAHSKISTQANPVVEAQVEYAKLRFSLSSEIYCGNISLHGGGYMLPPAGQTCLDPGDQPPAFVADSAFTVFHPIFQSSERCQPGSFASFSLRNAQGIPNITLRCLPCTENTFASSSGSRACSVCPNGTYAAAGAASCTSISGGSAVNAAAIAGPIVAALILIIVAIVVYPTLKWHWVNRHCPQDSAKDFTVLFLSLKDEGALKERFLPDEWNSAVAHVRERVRTCVTETECHEVRRLGDATFLITATTPDRALRCALRSRELLRATDWATLMPHGPIAASFVGRMSASNSKLGKSQKGSKSPHKRPASRQLSPGQQSLWCWAGFQFASGLAHGKGLIALDPETRTIEISGGVVNTAAVIADTAQPDQTLASESVVNAVPNLENVCLATEFCYVRYEESPLHLFQIDDVNCGDKRLTFALPRNGHKTADPDEESLASSFVSGGGSARSDYCMPGMQNAFGAGSIFASLQEQSTGMVAKPICCISLFVPELTNAVFDQRRLESDALIRRIKEVVSMVVDICASHKAHCEGVEDGRFRITVNARSTASHTDQRAAACAIALVSQLRASNLSCFCGLSSGSEVVGHVQPADGGGTSIPVVSGLVASNAQHMERLHQYQPARVLAVASGAFAQNVEIFAEIQALDFVVFPNVVTAASPVGDDASLHSLTTIVEQCSLANLTPAKAKLLLQLMHVAPHSQHINTYPQSQAGSYSSLGKSNPEGAANNTNTRFAHNTHVIKIMGLMGERRRSEKEDEWMYELEAAEDDMYRYVNTCFAAEERRYKTALQAISARTESVKECGGGGESPPPPPPSPPATEMRRHHEEQHPNAPSSPSTIDEAYDRPAEQLHSQPVATDGPNKINLQSCTDGPSFADAMLDPSLAPDASEKRALVGYGRLERIRGLGQGLLAYALTRAGEMKL